MIITWDFNESVCSVNMQNFMTEKIYFMCFSEINGVQPNQREAVHGNRIDIKKYNRNRNN